MPLKAVLSEDEFHELSEDDQQHYKNEDGSYVLSWDLIKDHPGVQKVKKTATNNHKTAQQLQEDRDAIKRRLGKIAETDDLDLSEADDETVDAALQILRGEADPAGGASGQQKDGNKSLDLDKIKEQARKPLQREMDALKQERDKLQAQLNNVIVENALNSAVSEARIPAEYAKAVKAMFAGSVKIDTDENGTPVAVIEGEYGEQPVAKHIKEWANSDEGRPFTGVNAGAGAPGDRGGPSSGPNPFSDKHWDMTEQARIARENPDKARRMAAAVGRSLRI